MEETVSIGCEFIVLASVAEDLREQLRCAVGEILEDYSDEEIIDYGVD